MRANEDLSAAGDFRRKCEGEIEFRPRSHLLINEKVNAASRDVARLSVLGLDLELKRRANDNGKGEFITTSCAPLGHKIYIPRIKITTVPTPPELE
jgi:hypothetical protein